MAKRVFYLEIYGTATIWLDNAVIDVVDDEWRRNLYDLRTPEDIAKHIGYNLIFNGASLSHLDGWADLPDKDARAMRHDLDIKVKERR